MREPTYAEEACSEWWARFARATVPSEQRSPVANRYGLYRQKYGGSFTPRRGEHLVAKRVRDAA